MADAKTAGGEGVSKGIKADTTLRNAALAFCAIDSRTLVARRALMGRAAGAPLDATGDLNL